MQIEARVEALVVARFEAQVEARGWRRRLEAPGYRCGPVEAWGKTSVEAWVGGAKSARVEARLVVRF